VRGSYELGKER